MDAARTARLALAGGRRPVTSPVHTLETRLPLLVLGVFGIVVAVQIMLQG